MSLGFPSALKDSVPILGANTIVLQEYLTVDCRSWLRRTTFAKSRVGIESGTGILREEAAIFEGVGEGCPDVPTQTRN